MVDEAVREARKFVAQHRDSLPERGLAIAAEMEQRYIEYLSRLLDMDLKVDASVTVKVNGQKVKFDSPEQFAAWAAEAAKEKA